MKNFIPILLFGFLLILGSCQTVTKSEARFELLPSPSEMTISGQSKLELEVVEALFEKAKKAMLEKGSLDGIESFRFTLQPDLDLKKEGYLMEISADQISIQAPADAGLWYGLMTLGQLIQDAKDQNSALPLVKIKDEPALDYRAVHLDVKHHLEKKEYYFELMDRFAAQKINAVIVEIEDKLQYELQPKVGSSDAFSISEWKELSDYAMARHIRISPLVQGLGHASFILKHPEYIPLRDDPESDWAFNPLNEETYKVQFDLYEDALKAFPYANYLHVGGDEVHTTGRNSGKSPLELQQQYYS
ncbi:MAG: glycoside hydrolase family 20 zincin-like fold domain-containing protein, partial [Algoriphagus aquaeductus]|uniref:glycoside hydrolase family 20 zincin-like fold domain-containing protein n=1 Tax=Algoriphagus aquaeductus TaxID=475299 RepID=UPI003878FC8E